MEWKKGGGKQYGLQLRVKAPVKKAVKAAPLLRFDDGDDEENVEEDIARQAFKKKSVRDVEQQHKRAVEEDPTVFDYDAVYDEMKGNQARPILEDREKRESKYIGKLLEKAKARQREHDIVYERQLAKERAKEDHLYGDKEKFVTGAYKRKLMEEAKWKEEERIRELQEQAEEVTKKSDMSDFYRNLLNSNVAFGAKPVAKPSDAAGVDDGRGLEGHPHVAFSSRADETPATPSKTTADTEAPRSSETSSFLQSEGDVEPDARRHGSMQPTDANGLDAKGSQSIERVAEDTTEPAASSIERETTVRSDAGESRGDAVLSGQGGEALAERSSSKDSLSAAKERYLARKRQRDI